MKTLLATRSLVKSSEKPTAIQKAKTRDSPAPAKANDVASASAGAGQRHLQHRRRAHTFGALHRRAFCYRRFRALEGDFRGLAVTRLCESSESADRAIGYNRRKELRIGDSRPRGRRWRRI